MEQPVKASFNFAPREPQPGNEGEKYYKMNYVPSDGFPQTNFEYELVDGIDVHNMRLANFSLKNKGVEIVALKSRLVYEDFKDISQVQAIYLAEVIDLLRKKLRTNEIYVFDYLVRRQERSFPYLGDKPFQSSQPAAVAHIDHTRDDIEDRIRQIWKENAGSYLKRDYQVINTWKPINGTVQNWPVAYCDRDTVDYANGFVEVDDININTVNEVLNMHHNSAQRWYFVPEQRTDEAVLFTEFDSRSREAGVPHCAFQLADDESVPWRESIEIRALAFY